MRKVRVSIAPILFSFYMFAVGCADEHRQYEDYHLTSTADLNLQATNHRHGFGRSQCFVCHNPSNIHQVNRINAPNFDLAQPLVNQSGLASCSGCHGSNGVP